MLRLVKMGGCREKISLALTLSVETLGILKVAKPMAVTEPPLSWDILLDARLIEQKSFQNTTLTEACWKSFRFSGGTTIDSSMASRSQLARTGKIKTEVTF